MTDITILVVAMILLASVSLILQETQTNIYAPVHALFVKTVTYLGDHSMLGRTIKKGMMVLAIEKETADLKAYKDNIERLMKEAGVKFSGVYGGDYAWAPVAVHIDPKSLHLARGVMRELFGSWNDEIVPGHCDEDYSTKKHMLHVSYDPKEELERKTRISTKYDLEDLPKGLLKEGCKVEKEYVTTVTCSVRCAA
jgi:hypothetical protein